MNLESDDLLYAGNILVDSEDETLQESPGSNHYLCHDRYKLRNVKTEKDKQQTVGY